MRDALTITIMLTGLFLVAGYVYKVMTPHFAKLGIIETAPVSQVGGGGLFRSQDFGRSWRSLGTSAIGSSEIFEIEFDAQNPDTLKVAAASGLFESKDGGTSWARVFGEGLSRSESVNSFEVDISSPGRMYIAANSRGGRGRILKFRNEQFYEVYSTILEGDKVLGVWMDPRDTSILFAGTQKGLFLESRDFGESWTVKKEFSEAVSSLRLLEGDGGIMFAQVGGNVLKSANRGASWQDITFPLKDVYEGSFRTNQFTLDPHNQNHLYLATSAGLLRSLNGGASFSPLELLAAGEEPRVGAVELDPSAAGVIYIGVNSQVHKSEDGGKSWQIKELPSGRAVSIIKVKPDNPTVVFAGFK